MSGKSLIPLVIGLGIGGFALKLVFDTVKRAQGAKPEIVAVWAAAEDIPRGVAIEETMITAMQYPSSNVPQGAFKKKEDLIGRVPRTTAPAGLPLMESILLPPGAKPGLWVKPGYRAVSIKIDESSGVSNLLQPGSSVDVVGYFNVVRNKKRETISRTLIENVEVAAVGARISAGNENQDGKVAPPARAVTLFVKPNDVPTIHLAEQQGKIKLSMRSSEDGSEHAGDDSATSADVIGWTDETVAATAPTEDMMARVQALLEERDKALAERLDELNKNAPALAGGIGKPAWVMTVWNGDNRSDLGWTSLDSMEPIQLPTPGKEKQPKNAPHAFGPGAQPYPNQQPPVNHSHPPGTPPHPAGEHTHPANYGQPDDLPQGVPSGDQPEVISNEGSIPD